MRCFLSAEVSGCQWNRGIRYGDQGRRKWGRVSDEGGGGVII